MASNFTHFRHREWHAHDLSRVWHASRDWPSGTDRNIKFDHQWMVGLAVQDERQRGRRLSCAALVSKTFTLRANLN